MARLTKDEWVSARTKWERSTRDGFEWMTKGLGVDRSVISRRAKKEDWCKKSTDNDEKSTEKDTHRAKKDTQKSTADNKESIDDKSTKIVHSGMGRPAGVPNKLTRAFKEYASQYTEEALDQLVSIMRNSENEDTVIKAAIEVINRGVGRPAQAVEVSGEVTQIVSIDELDLILQEGLEKIQQQRDELPARLEQLKSGEWLDS